MTPLKTGGFKSDVCVCGGGGGWVRACVRVCVHACVRVVVSRIVSYHHIISLYVLSFVL